LHFNTSVNLSIQLSNTAFDYIAFGTLVNKHDTSKSSASNNINSFYHIWKLHKVLVKLA